MLASINAPKVIMEKRENIVIFRNNQTSAKKNYTECCMSSHFIDLPKRLLYMAEKLFTSSPPFGCRVTFFDGDEGAAGAGSFTFGFGFILKVQFILTCVFLCF